MKSRGLFERITDNWPVKILSVVAAILLFLFYRISNLEERFLSIPLQTVTNDSFVPAAPLPDAVRVTVRGKADTVFLVRENDIDAYVDLSRFNTSGVFKAPIELRRKGTAIGNDVEMKVDPLELTVTLEKKASKNVKVYPTIKGSPAKGDQLEQYFVTPNEVEIEGPESKVDAITSLSTADIDLTGKTQDFSQRAALVVSDPTVHVIGSPDVVFHGTIRPIVVMKSISPVDVVTLDLNPAFQMTSDFKFGNIRIQGTQTALNDLMPGDVTLVVECSGIHTPGVYTLPTKASVPQGITVLSYGPEKVTLTVTRGRSTR